MECQRSPEMDGALEAKGPLQKVNHEFETWFETIRDLQGEIA